MESKQIKIKEQEEIVNLADKSLIVSASAGSGKTSVMIRKILKYVLEKKCHVDELLVLTYTKSAAQEMKKKLVDKLRENVDNSPELLEELAMVQSADISTFDSFCQKLVKKYFYILNIDPAFDILDAGNQNYFQGLAINSAIKKLKQKSPEKYELLMDNFSPKRDEEKIKEIILQIYNYSTSLLKIDDFVQKNLKFYSKNDKIAENYLNFYYNSIIGQIKENLEKLKKKSADFGFKYVLYINNLIINIERFESAKRFAEKIEYCKNVDYGKLLSDKSDEIGLKDLIAKEKSRLKTTFDEIVERFVSLENVDNSYNECGKLANVIFELLGVFIEKYQIVKEKNNTYDFNDIERFTIKLLENKEVCNEIKSFYKYIFVDEFQDANAVQERIIFLLENNNLFFVGDTKQSIYAFRQSDPEIFLKIEDAFEESLNAEAKTLNCNFRTNKNILYFINNVFNVIMTEKTAGLNYRQKAQFDPKATYQDLENEINVSINLIAKNEKEEKQPAKTVYSVKQNKSNISLYNSYQEECLFICDQIAKLIGEPIYDKELGKTRPIGYEDITILVAKRGAFLDTLCGQFTELGIPYIVSANQNLEEMYDNIVLYNLLKYANNSKDDYALYTILSSPLFNFSDSELAYIKSKNADCEYFYDAVNNFNEIGDIYNKLKKFKNIIQEFAFDVNYKGIYFAFNKILKETNYLLTISFEDRFQSRKINIEEFVNSFCGFKYNNDLSGYLIYRETAIRGQKAQTEKANLKAVEITTMHSSKGLEYPVVILPNLDADNLRTPFASDIKINKDFGVGLKSYNQEDRSVVDGIFYHACNLKNKLLEQSEKIRLLYVAMTRAKNKLILVGRNTQNYSCFYDDYDVLQTNTFMGLVLGTLNKSVLDRINNGETFITKLINDKIELNCSRIEENKIVAKNVIMPKPSQETEINYISEFLNKNIAEQKTDIALKNSVSGFAFDDNTSVNLAPNKFAISEHLAEKASELGTLYHSILERINFDNTNSIDDVKQFVECEYSLEELQCIKDFGYDKIYNNIVAIKSLIQPKDKLLKEQKFVMCVPHNLVAGGDIKDKILVQGIIDLLIIKPQMAILVDYKLTSKTNQQIKEKYNKQLHLYEMAIKSGLDLPIKKYILNLNKNELIEIDD